MTRHTVLAALVLAALGLAACARPAPVQEPANQQLQVVVLPRPGSARARVKLPPPLVSAARPEVDALRMVPDPIEELRWPLRGMVHPVLEPQFAIAPVFAVAGVGWHELCARGVQNRTAPGIDRDLVTYLRAWCHAANRDIDLAIGELGGLRNSMNIELAEVVRIDIANIVADAGPGELAQKLLARAMLDDTALDDVIAATYAEVGSLADATLFNDLAIAAHGPPGLHCHRLAKRIVIAGATTAVASVEQLARLAAATPPASPPDPACVRLDAELGCWAQPATSCIPYFRANQIDVKWQALLTLYFHWPDRAVKAERWRAIANDAITALPVPGADAFAASAITQALRGSPCVEADIEPMARLAGYVLDDPTHEPALDAVLTRAAQEPRSLCDAR